MITALKAAASAVLNGPIAAALLWSLQPRPRFAVLDMVDDRNARSGHCGDLRRSHLRFTQQPFDLASGVFGCHAGVGKRAVAPGFGLCMSALTLSGSGAASFAATPDILLVSHPFKIACAVVCMRVVQVVNLCLALIGWAKERHRDDLMHKQPDAGISSAQVDSSVETLPTGRVITQNLSKIAEATTTGDSLDPTKAAGRVVRKLRDYAPLLGFEFFNGKVRFSHDATSLKVADLVRADRGCSGSGLLVV